MNRVKFMFEAGCGVKTKTRLMWTVPVGIKSIYNKGIVYKVDEVSYSISSRTWIVFLSKI